MIRDRAALITIAVFEITAASSIPEAERRAPVENLIRDELADIERQAAADRADDA